MPYVSSLILFLSFNILSKAPPVVVVVADAVAVGVLLLLLLLIIMLVITRRLREDGDDERCQVTHAWVSPNSCSTITQINRTDTAAKPLWLTGLKAPSN